MTVHNILTDIMNEFHYWRLKRNFTENQTKPGHRSTVRAPTDEMGAWAGGNTIIDLIGELLNRLWGNQNIHCLIGVNTDVYTRIDVYAKTDVYTKLTCSD